MNERGVGVLVDAAMRGQKQVRGMFYDGQGGMCASAVLSEALNRRAGVGESWSWDSLAVITEAYDLTGWRKCPECGDKMHDLNLVAHLNDAHSADFLTIARKMASPEPAAGATP